MRVSGREGVKRWSNKTVKRWKEAGEQELMPHLSVFTTVKKLELFYLDLIYPYFNTVDDLDSWCEYILFPVMQQIWCEQQV